MYGPKLDRFYDNLQRLHLAEPLSAGDLRGAFGVDESVTWVAYKTKKGKLVVERAGKTGTHNAARAEAAGGKILGQCNAASRRAVLAAARKMP